MLPLNKALNSKSCYMSLACSIGSISLACGSLLQIPNTTDRISLQRGLFLTSLGFIYFISLTDFCNKYLLHTQHGQQFRKKYRLMMSDVMEITNKIVSAIQAFYSFLVGFIVCKSTCSKSFVYASHFLMEAYGWFGTAYFMYDIWAMHLVHMQTIADKLKLKRLSERANGNGNGNGDGNGNRNQQLGKCGNGNSAGMYDKHSFGRQRQQNTNGTMPTTTESTSTATTSATPNTQIIAGATTTQTPTGAIHSCQHEDELYDFDGESMQLAKSGGKWSFLKYVISHPVIIIHHIFIGTFGLLVVTYIRGGGHCIYSYMYMMEFSTPFVSLRSILSTMKLKDSRTYVINGLTMLATFFVCRVFMWPYVMWRYSLAINVGFWEAFVGLPTGCIISIMILFLPQIYWFYLMVKGALKVFFPNKSKSATKKMEYSQSKSKNNNLSPVTPTTPELKELALNGKTFLTNNSTRNTNMNSTSNGNATADILTSTLNTTSPILDVPINGKH